MSALMFHDVVAAGDEDQSGFPGRDAALYKVTPERFDEQISALTALATHHRPIITFDDGGVSAMGAADVLERHGLTGCFFITVNFIGTRGFVTEPDIRELRERGHTIGSHSCSHPLRLAQCSTPRLLDEWTRSRAALIEIMGEDVTTASVPGGGFSMRVAAAAAAAGLTQLFTSEPTTRIHTIEGLELNGRFTIRRRTSTPAMMNLVTGRGLARVQQQTAWSLKKLMKRIAGAPYVHARRLVYGGVLK